MKMAKLKVVFPHIDDEGNRYLPGDYREVPASQLEFHLRPSLNENVVVMALNPEVWKPDHAVAKYPNADTPAAFFEDRPESAPQAVAGDVVSPVEIMREDLAKEAAEMAAKATKSKK